MSMQCESNAGVYIYPVNPELVYVPPNGASFGVCICFVDPM